MRIVLGLYTLVYLVLQENILDKIQVSTLVCLITQWWMLQ